MRSAAGPVDDLEATLRAAATPERAEHGRAYLKSDLVFLGATVPAIRKAATALHPAHPGDRDALLAEVEPWLSRWSRDPDLWIRRATGNGCWRPGPAEVAGGSTMRRPRRAGVDERRKPGRTT